MKACLITKYRLIKVWSSNYFPIIINPIKHCNYMNSLFQITNPESSEGPQRRFPCCLPSSDGNTETLRGEMTCQRHIAVQGRAGLNPSSCPHRPLLASRCHRASLRRKKGTLSSPRKEYSADWAAISVSPHPQSYLGSSLVSLWNL